MLDIQLRPLKDRLFDPCCRYIPASITPLDVTCVAFLSGLASCLFAYRHYTTLSLLFWGLNRGLDCLDGALARHRNTASDLGGFLDLLGDFIIYALLPIHIAGGWHEAPHIFGAVALLEASFYINNFILFYVAAVAEKMKKEDAHSAKTKELTSLMMRPALIEGTESGVLFTTMLAFPGQIETLSYLMAGLVSIGICQRVVWTVRTMS